MVDTCRKVPLHVKLAHAINHLSVALLFETHPDVTRPPPPCTFAAKRGIGKSTFFTHPVSHFAADFSYRVMISGPPLTEKRAVVKRGADPARVVQNKPPEPEPSGCPVWKCSFRRVETRRRNVFCNLLTDKKTFTDR
jgi:hypothetical protein